MDIVAVGGPDCTLDLYRISRKLYVFVIRCLVTRGCGQNLTTPVSVSIFFRALLAVCGIPCHQGRAISKYRNFSPKDEIPSLFEAKDAVFYLLKAREAHDTQETFSRGRPLIGWHKNIPRTRVWLCLAEFTRTLSELCPPNEDVG